MRTFCLDTSGFLDGFVRYYPPDVFESLWDLIDELGSAGRLLVPEEVHKELEYHHDEAFDWVNERKDEVVVPTTAAVAQEVTDILLDYPGFVKEGSTRNRADPFVVATAALEDAVVVTGERQRGGTQTNPKIPTVCEGRGVPYARFLGVVQEEGWSF